MSAPAAANTAAARAFVDGLARAGVRHACVTPGSRSTPLTVALAEQSAIRSWLHLDERASAFFALLLAGAEDAKYAAIAAEMAAAMPTARAELVPDAGHAAHLENAAYCARIITAFHGEGTGA